MTSVSEDGQGMQAKSSLRMHNQPCYSAPHGLSFCLWRLHHLRYLMAARQNELFMDELSFLLQDLGPPSMPVSAEFSPCSSKCRSPVRNTMAWRWTYPRSKVSFLTGLSRGEIALKAASQAGPVVSLMTSLCISLLAWAVLRQAGSLKRLGGLLPALHPKLQISGGEWPLQRLRRLPPAVIEDGKLV